MKPQELWARSFAQYIAGQPRQEDLIAYLQTTMEDRSRCAGFGAAEYRNYDIRIGAASIT